jgi:hypothetical protein
MRLRTLSEAECYARCYGAKSEDRVSVVKRLTPRATHAPRGEELRELFEERLESRGPEQEAA